ncbi:MAG: glycine oxidase ThiO [Vicinamibacterales bacterium]
MAEISDIAIIGAGIVGCAIARELAIRGLRVVVFDDRPIAGGATQASAGMLAPYVEAHEPGPLLALGVDSLAMYDDWIRAVAAESREEIEYRRAGTLEIALDADQAAALRAAAEGDPGRRRWLAVDDVRQHHRALGATAGGVFVAAHGYVAPPELTEALARAAERHSARFEARLVRSIDRRSGAVRLETQAGAYDAASVVIAAGSWANSIEGITLPPIVPVRGQSLRLDWHGRPIDTIVWGPECYIVPRADGSIYVGATVEDVGFDERNTAAGLRDLLDAACELLPEAWGATFVEARAGLRPRAPDGLPVIGPSSDAPEIVHALGHYRNGVLLAPITARLIADWIVDRRRDPAFDTFAASRFS